jgi:signal peptidase II
MTNGVKSPLFWAVTVGVVATDVVTKQLAVLMLQRGVPQPVFGEWLLLRLVYNPGAAFGIYVGPYSRWIFTALAAVALVVLGSLVLQTHRGQWFRLTTLGLICGGATGNLVNRLRSSQGVVDFLDVWIGPLHWPTFNVADMAVTVGALSLAAILWFEGRQQGGTAPQPADTAEA